MGQEVLVGEEGSERRRRAVGSTPRHLQMEEAAEGTETGPWGLEVKGKGEGVPWRGTAVQPRVSWPPQCLR